MYLVIATTEPASMERYVIPVLRNTYLNSVSLKYCKNSVTACSYVADRVRTVKHVACQVF